MKRNLKVLVTIVMILLMLVGGTGCSQVNGNEDKKALLVVSFGSSYLENRELAIDATEEVIKNNFPEYDFYNAFTSQIIIDIYADRDGVDIDNVEEAIEKIYKAGYGEVLIVPTLIINGAEKDEMLEQLDPYKDLFSKLTISSALLTTYDDYLDVIEALDEEMPETEEGEAIVLFGHGTHHFANSAYGALDYTLKDEGYDHVFVGTVEGFPSYNTVLKQLKDQGYKKVTLMPIMLVAGDHAHNDMAGDEADSWKQLFKSEGFDVEYIMQGLGELPSIQQQFVEHANAALAGE